jgi:electron-transferring-flavoprotein dehydrogenase
MSDESVMTVERQQMAVDIACVGFGPAMGGFLTTLSRSLAEAPAESAAAPGMPLQVLCYERADDLAAGVSGVVTSARAIRASFPEIASAEVPMLTPVRQEKVLYLLDPVGASHRSATLRLGDALIRPLSSHHAFELPYTPEFLNKHGGLVMSIGQFNQWVGNQLMAAGVAQLWPSSPVSEALFEDNAVAGVRLADQGVDRQGDPEACYMPGMDVHAQLTVVGDGPVGAVGQSIDRKLGLPAGHARSEWAVGMKMVVELPQDTPLEAGTVWHTFGFPEPEIFGFLYVHPECLASVGIFVPSWMPNPGRSAYRYLQHFMQHPYLWRYLQGSTMRSWGAKSLQESGMMGEPYLVGNGFARIGEGSGSTNMLTGSGVDEAWATGAMLGEAVVELLRAGKPFTRGNLEATYLRRRHASFVAREGKVAKHARHGFHSGLVRGLIGMALAGYSKGKLALGANIPPAHRQIESLESYYAHRLSPEKLSQARVEAASGKRTLHDALMDACGWPQIEYDGTLLVSHQDALLMGGKVQAAPGFADHVIFRDPVLCERCAERTCISMCSGQAITEGEEHRPAFDREKCVHCGACLWNCAHSPDDTTSNIEFRAGAGGLHSAEN